MTITQMQYFVAVCEHGSISKAADVLHVSRPSISIAIKELESQYGVTLFNRENKRFTLTHEGQFMYDNVKQILQQINALDVQMNEMGNKNREIQIMIPISTGLFMSSFFLSGFRKEHPDIKFSVRQHNSAQAIKTLDDNSSDMAIMAAVESLPANLEKREIFTSEFVFCTSEKSPLAKKKSISLQDLDNVPIVLSEENSYVVKMLKKSFYEYKIVPNIVMHGVSLNLIQKMILESGAGSFMIREQSQQLPGIVSIPLDEHISITFYLVWRKDKYLNKNVQTLIHYILDKAETITNIR